jgi:hypothetical protein
VSTPLIGLVAVKFEASWQQTPELAQARERTFSRSIPRNIESTLARNRDFDFVAGFQLQRFNNGPGQTDRQAITPFCNLH